MIIRRYDRYGQLEDIIDRQGKLKDRIDKDN